MSAYPNADGYVDDAGPISDLAGEAAAVEAVAMMLYCVRSQERERWQKKARGHAEDHWYVVWPAWFELSPIQQQAWMDQAVFGWLPTFDRWHDESARRAAL